MIHEHTLYMYSVHVCTAVDGIGMGKPVNENMHIYIMYRLRRFALPWFDL